MTKMKKNEGFEKSIQILDDRISFIEKWFRYKKSENVYEWPDRAMMKSWAELKEVRNTIVWAYIESSKEQINDDKA
jgi:hypothetical protein